jgi:hypothetical protein
MRPDAKPKSVLWSILRWPMFILIALVLALVIAITLKGLVVTLSRP